MICKIENLKIGCAVRKDRIMRVLAEDIDAGDVLDAIEVIGVKGF